MDAGCTAALVRYAAAEILLAAGGTVLAPPAVRLTFTHTPIAMGSRILVKDKKGTNQSDGPVVVVDNHVSQAVKAGAGGETGQPATASVPASPVSAPNPGRTVASPWGLAAGGAVLAAGLARTALHVRRRLANGDTDGPVS